MKPDSGRDCTIDELAAQTGVPTRTIREYQRLELLPSPQREGRIGKYGMEHRARLAIIGRLQERGYSLAAIGDLIGSWEQGRGLGAVLGIDANPGALDETPTKIQMSDLVERIPSFEDPQRINDALAVGLIHRVEGDVVLVRSVAAIELMGLTIDAGVPPSAALEVAAGLRDGAAVIAKAAVHGFLEHLWPRRDTLDVARVLSQARLLLAQSAASLVVHELGVALTAQAADEHTEELAAVIDKVAIKQIRHLADLTNH